MRAIAIIILILPSYLFAQKNAPKEIDIMVKNLKPLNDKALVYFTNYSISKKLIIYNDSSLLGQINSGQYAYKVLDPKNHLFYAYNGKKKNLIANRTINLKPNNIYYLGLEKKGLFNPKISIVNYNKVQAKEWINNLDLSANSSLYNLFEQNSIDYYNQGLLDAKMYYNTKQEETIGLLSGLVPIGIFAEIVQLASKPKEKKLFNSYNLNNDLISANSDYRRGYMKGAKSKVVKNSLKKFAIGLLISVAAVSAVLVVKEIRVPEIDLSFSGVMYGSVL